MKLKDYKSLFNLDDKVMFGEEERRLKVCGRADLLHTAEYSDHVKSIKAFSEALALLRDVNGTIMGLTIDEAAEYVKLRYPPFNR